MNALPPVPPPAPPPATPLAPGPAATERRDQADDGRDGTPRGSDERGARAGGSAAPPAGVAALPRPVLRMDARIGAMGRAAAAWADLRDGTRLWRLALSLGFLDIRLRYRGSLLGPFWLTLSSAVMVASMGAVFSLLFHTSLRGYLPFLSVSIILWQAGIGALAGEACTSFTGAEQTIRSMRMPFTVQVLRTVWRNLLVLAHNIVVPLAVFAIFGAWPGVEAVLSLPGLLLWIVDGMAACFLLGAICARFRDIPPIVGSLLQIAYYVTPVIWNPSQLGAKGWWLPLNPFFPLMEVVRAPLLGHVPSAMIWEAAVGYSLAFCLVSALLFIRARSRIAFWV
ncbi:ABC transporter permease [Rhizosaccharibacter radicis]|uniref:ABC transporter permease n=1 Tax=Rhizosaccharibacter radicis TaxID=2782605 RepID=A0ABT1W0J4_9PROT|nr:ABC transporter permease [Acetobacteraceae bacterium KSS12]